MMNNLLNLFIFWLKQWLYSRVESLDFSLFSFPDFITVGCASVSLSDSVKNLCVTFDCHLTVKTHVSNLVRSADFELLICPQMPQRLLSLPSFFHVLIIATLFFLAVLSISYTNYSRFRTTLLALFWEFLKLTTFLLILLLFIGCPLIHGYSTNSLVSVIIAATRLLLTTWLNSWEYISQPANFAHLLILPFSVFPLYVHTRLVKGHFLCCADSLEHSPLRNQVIQHHLILQVIT